MKILKGLTSKRSLSLQQINIERVNPKVNRSTKKGENNFIVISVSSYCHTINVTLIAFMNNSKIVLRFET